jgi:uncharacterized protein (TIGR04141 family)
MTKEARFKLPRTTVVSEPAEVLQYDEKLIKELTTPGGVTDFTHNSYDLYGIDFVFSNDGSFRLKCPGYTNAKLADLSMVALQDYIISKKLPPEDVLKIKIVHEHEGHPKYTQEIKQALDFIVDSDRVILSNGRWMRFNQDYLDFLDEYLESIRSEDVEPEFVQVVGGEPEFNVSEAVRDAGYTTADKNFSIFRTKSSTLVEAWDLQKGDCVYAVKFGSAQKLGYVCDQATAVLELLRNRANVNEIPNFNRYCLWLGYSAVNPLKEISKSGSIILKQKIETWARKTRELGLEPVLKISHKVR